MLKSCDVTQIGLYAVISHKPFKIQSCYKNSIELVSALLTSRSTSNPDFTWHRAYHAISLFYKYADHETALDWARALLKSSKIVLLRPKTHANSVYCNFKKH